jgi:hypothetical protein
MAIPDRRAAMTEAKKAAQHPNMVRQVSAAAIAITGKHYCTSHMGYTDADNGELVPGRRGNRWVCFPCQSRRIKR